VKEEELAIHFRESFNFGVFHPVEVWGPRLRIFSTVASHVGIQSVSSARCSFSGAPLLGPDEVVGRQKLTTRKPDVLDMDQGRSVPT